MEYGWRLVLDGRVLRDLGRRNGADGIGDFMKTLKEYLGDRGTVAGLSRNTGISRRQLYYW